MQKTRCFVLAAGKNRCAQGSEGLRLPGPGCESAGLSSPRGVAQIVSDQPAALFTTAATSMSEDCCLREPCLPDNVHRVRCKLAVSTDKPRLFGLCLGN